MNRQRKKGLFKTEVTIYHHELNLEFEHQTTYFLITEMKNGEPQITYYYKIPDNYKDDSLLGELHERYARYSPN
jgi:hypothetical protein